MIQLRLTGGPLGDRRGFYQGPDERDLRTLYATPGRPGQDVRLSADLDGPFTVKVPAPTYVYRRAGMVPDDEVLFEYVGEADEL